MKSVVQKVPYVGPIAGGVGIALDIKEVAENSTPIGVVKTVGVRFIKECTPPEIYYTGKCLWFIGSVVTSIYTGGNPMAVSAAASAARSIIRG